MKTLLALVVTVVVAWLQISWFGHMRPLGVMPDLVLVAVVTISLWSNATPAVVSALGGGLVLDMASGSDFGLRLGFFVVVALALIAGRQLGLQADGVLTALAAVALGTLLYNLVVIATLGGVPIGLAASRIGRELIVNEAILLLVFIVKLNIDRPNRSALEVGGRVAS